MPCIATDVAVLGQYANLGTATGTPPSGPDVTDSDPGHYFGQSAPVPTLPEIGLVTLALLLLSCSLLLLHRRG